MASNEAIELLEQVLSESKGFRKYKQNAVDKTQEIGYKAGYDNYDNPIKMANEIRKNLKPLKKDYKEKVGIVGSYAPDQYKAAFDIAQGKKEDPTTVGYKAGNKHYNQWVADQVAKADKRQRGQVVGGYKLEAACILIEALDTLLGE